MFLFFVRGLSATTSIKKTLGSVSLSTAKGKQVGPTKKVKIESSGLPAHFPGQCTAGGTPSGSSR